MDAGATSGGQGRVRDNALARQLSMLRAAVRTGVTRRPGSGQWGVSELHKVELEAAGKSLLSLVRATQSRLDVRLSRSDGGGNSVGRLGSETAAAENGAVGAGAWQDRR